MKRKVKKFLSMILTIIIVALMLNIIWRPTIATAITYNFSAEWTKQGESNVMTKTTNVMSSIVSIITTVGTGISIIMIIYVAIKYMSAAPDEKAEFKKSATAFIVGAVVLFGTSQIINIINTFATNATSTLSNK